MSHMTHNDELATLLIKYPDEVLKEADVRLKEAMDVEAARRKVFDDKAGRYFMGAGAMVGILGGAGVLLVRLSSSGTLRAERESLYLLLPALAILWIGTMVTSCHALEVMKLKTALGLSVDDMVTRENAGYSILKNYMIMQVQNREWIVRAAELNNEKRAKALALCEDCMLFTYVVASVFLLPFVVITFFRSLEVSP